MNSSSSDDSDESSGGSRTIIKGYVAKQGKPYAMAVVKVCCKASAS